MSKVWRSPMVEEMLTRAAIDANAFRRTGSLLNLAYLIKVIDYPIHKHKRSWISACNALPG